MFRWFRNLEAVNRRLVQIMGQLTLMGRTLHRLERRLMAIRDEFTSELEELGTAITELARRIEELPQDANDVTQADLDQLRASVSRVNDLAVQSDDIPTGGTDPEPLQPGQQVPDQG